MNEKLLASIRFYFAQSVFNNLCHFKAADRLLRIENNLSFSIAALSAVTIISLTLQIIGLEERFQSIVKISSIIGLFVTAASLIVERFNKGNRIQEIFQHKMYAEKYKMLRDEYMLLIEETMSCAFPEDQIRIRRDNLQKHYSMIGENAPTTNTSDYKQTQIGLGIAKKEHEEFTWSDQEINKFLPLQLRI